MRLRAPFAFAGAAALADEVAAAACAGSADVRSAGGGGIAVGPAISGIAVAPFFSGSASWTSGEAASVDAEGFGPRAV